MCQICKRSSHAKTVTKAITNPLRISDKNIIRIRGSRSTTTPPINKKNSMGICEKTNTVPIAIAEPVFSNTHHDRAIRYKLSPNLDVV